MLNILIFNQRTNIIISTLYFINIKPYFVFFCIFFYDNKITYCY